MAQILTVPPYTVAILILYLTVHTSDRLQRRGVFLIGTGTFAGIGYMSVSYVLKFLLKTDDGATRRSLLVAIPSNVHLRYFATFCICAGTSANVALVLTWCAWHHRLHGRPSYLTFPSCSLPQPRLRDEEGSRHAVVHVHRPLREHTGLPLVSNNGRPALCVGIFS